MAEPQDLLGLARAKYVEGRFGEAEVVLRQVHESAPDFPEARHLLGIIAYRNGRLEAAACLIVEALIWDCRLAGAHGNLGVIRQAQGRRDEAIRHYRRALDIAPYFADALCNLCVALIEMGKLTEAVSHCRKTAAIHPEDYRSYFNFGLALQDLSLLDEGTLNYRRALSINPGRADAAVNLGNIFNSLGRLKEAVETFKLAVALQPDSPLVYAGFGLCLRDQAEISDAVLNLERALRIKIDLYKAQSNLLLTYHYTDTVTSEEILVKSRLLAAQLGRPAPASAFPNSRQEDRSLRVGYVSSDFREHSVAYFLEPLLKHHDPDQVEVFCYSGVTAPDTVTRRLQALGGNWRQVGGMADIDMIELIRRDHIDILVDLSGYTGGNRIPVFARRAAPIQVSWLGYPGSTGVEAMDYRLVDEVTDPEGESDKFASEALIRVPDGFLCYQPPDQTPDIEPNLVSRPITFGSFNNPAKLSSETLDLWAEIMRHLPEARLLLKGHAFADDGVRKRFLHRFAVRGVVADRIELIGQLPAKADHLTLYGDIDIALDTSPYNGTTTTCEALWMGVPVITLPGTRHSSRVGASLLTSIGLSELAASSREDYVETAVRLAQSSERRAALSRSLRTRMLKSSLCDGPSFADKIEAIYRMMWRRWCRSKPSNPAELEHPLRSNLVVELSNGTKLAVPETVDSLTTYVLLEQERWFEKEFDFVLAWLRPGMAAVDIGANLGVYSLSMAHRVGSSGQVVAYEPSSDTVQYLVVSKAMNSLENMVVRPLALSDRAKQGYLAFGASSELNALGESGPGEMVAVSSLDEEYASGDFLQPDFVKIDAEGEEARILLGGRTFFERHSPLVMFEIDGGKSVKETLQSSFSDMGYRLYRCLAGLPVLVPANEANIDSFELNLFAAKADRAASLRLSGHLVEELPEWRPDRFARERLRAFLRQTPYAASFPACFGSSQPKDEAYEDCLAAFANWLSPDVQLPQRCASLDYAASTLTELCREKTTFARLLTLARVTWEAGRRDDCNKALLTFISEIKKKPFLLHEPFWPASPRFDTLPTGSGPGDWALASAVELFERSRSFSSYFLGPSEDLGWLCGTPFASAEMLRRKALSTLRKDGKLSIPAKLRSAQDDNRNASLWADGKVKM